MLRRIHICITLLLLSVSISAESSLPIIEVKADRTVIYPQRMELTGEETLMDILQMMPSLMIAGYEDVISDYSLRIDNCPINGDNRLVVGQMKAKDIDCVQVCDNTGVAKGSVGMNRVLDIYMKMPDALHGFVEGQGGLGKDFEGAATANALYGGRRTDLYANVSYRHHDVNEQYLTLRMNNRFDDRNRLLTFFTQQFQDHHPDKSRKVMGRARYFHTFNEQGTELLLAGYYQYASNQQLSNKLPTYMVELNTPLFSKRLSMMLGVEGDFLMTRQKHTDGNWHVFNNDVYSQFTYSLPQWRLTVGHRVSFYNYKVADAGISQSHSDVRHNANACVIYAPGDRNLIQLGYYRKYYNPLYELLFMNVKTLSDEELATIEEQLDERDINQVKLSYAYSRQKLTVQTEASYYVIEDGENLTELGASVYWKARGVSLSGGSNLYASKRTAYASFRLAPTVSLPCQWQVGLQMVFYTKNSPWRETSGVPVYGCLSVNKQLGKRWSLAVDWHDMFDVFRSEKIVNRHAANIKAQYRF